MDDDFMRDMKENHRAIEREQNRRDAEAAARSPPRPRSTTSSSGTSPGTRLGFAIAGALAGAAVAVNHQLDSGTGAVEGLADGFFLRELFAIAVVIAIFAALAALASGQM